MFASLKCIMVSTEVIDLLRENIYSCLMVLLFPASAIYISTRSLHHQLFCITAKSLSNNSNLGHSGSQLQDFLDTQYSLSSTKCHITYNCYSPTIVTGYLQSLYSHRFPWQPLPTVIYWLTFDFTFLSSSFNCDNNLQSVPTMNMDKIHNSKMKFFLP